MFPDNISWNIDILVVINVWKNNFGFHSNRKTQGQNHQVNNLYFKYQVCVVKLRHLNTFLQSRLLFHEPHCRWSKSLSINILTKYYLISLNSARFSTFVRQKLVPFHHPMPHPPMAPLPRLPLAILTALPAPTQTSWSRRTGNVWRCGCWRWKSSRFSTGTWRFSKRNFRYVWFIYCSPSSCEWRPFLMKDFRLVIRTPFVCKTLHGYWLVFIDIDEVLIMGSQAFYLFPSAHNLT